MITEELKIDLSLYESRFSRPTFSFLKIFSRLRNIFVFRSRQKNAIIVADKSMLKHWLPIIFGIKNRWNYKIIGYVSETKFNANYPYLGTVSSFDKIIADNIVDSVIFMYQGQHWGKYSNLIQVANTQGKMAYLYDCDKMDAWSAYKNTISGSQEAIKDFFDFIIAIILLAILSPLFLIVSIIIRLNTVGSVIYRQKRVGKNGRIFTFYKFRSMIDDADLLKETLAKHNEMSGPAFKIKNDPRITPLGRFLRQTSLDELPQLFNVIKGEMSLVGPRPPVINEVKKYESWQRKRLSVKPGITCIWQVSGRSNIKSFDEWVNLDIKYINNYSFLLDLIIVLKTIPAVISRRGAM